MKKIISAIIALSMLVCLMPAAFAAQKGDVNNDGNVTSGDALLVLQYAVGQVKTIDKTRADVNGDGAINSADALIILQICVGLLSSEDISVKDTVALYNKALKTTYYKKALTLKYTSTDTGTISDLTAKKNTPFNDKTSKTLEYQDGINKITKDKVEETNPGFSLDSNGVKSVSVQKNSNGTRTVKIVLKEEKTDIFKLPVYNKQAAMPFVYTDEAISGTTVYTGTTLTLVINSKDEAVSLDIKMPYVCDYTQKVSGSIHSMRDTGTAGYTAEYSF